jgi:hypothetical protein
MPFSGVARVRSAQRECRRVGRLRVFASALTVAPQQEVVTPPDFRLAGFQI